MTIHQSIHRVTRVTLEEGKEIVLIVEGDRDRVKLTRNEVSAILDGLYSPTLHHGKHVKSARAKLESAF